MRMGDDYTTSEGDKIALARRWATDWLIDEYQVEFSQNMKRAIRMVEEREAKSERP